MKLSRRDFVRSSSLAAAAASVPHAYGGSIRPRLAEVDSGIRLGLASYTFRNFTRGQMIPFMKQLNISALNAKDVKDHLPMDTQEEAAAVRDYDAAGIKLHAAL